MPTKIDKYKLIQLLGERKTLTECADILGVSLAAVSRMRKTLELPDAVSKNVALEAAPKIVAKHLDCIQQLQDINADARKVLDDLSGSEDKVDKQIVLKACAEVRKQLSLQLDIFHLMYDMTAIADFQREVLAVIGECAPQVRDEIVKRLKEANALRAAVQFS
jgi:hypothetical protein